jgi:transcription elongation factor/antiterminator RfaH
MSCNGDEWGQSWVAAGTHPHKEPTAIANLMRQGFEAYCPMVRKRWRHARKVREVLRPLFPGYVFIAVDPVQHRWRPILSTTGVRTLIRFGDRLGVLPPRFVESLRSRESDGAVSFCYPPSSYAPGDKVRLCDGPFEGVIATVLAVEEHARLQILMHLLSRGVRVKVPANAVAPADASAAGLH